MPTLKDFYPFIARGREGPHEYTEYLPGEAPPPETYITKPPLEAYSSRSTSEIPIPPGGGAYISTPGEVRGGPILRAGGIDERIAELRGETAEIEAETARRRKRRLEYEAETARMLGKEKPPERFLSPFDPAFKVEFEKKVFAAIEKRHGIPGGNPHTMNIVDMVETISEKQLPKLWDNFTNQQVRWEDRETIKESFPKIWNNWIRTITQERTRISNGLKTRQASAIKDYEYNMGKLDTMVKTARANLVEQRRERLRQIEKAPQYRVNPAGELTLHEFDEASDDWVDTGKKKPPLKIQVERLVYDTKLKKSVYVTPSQMKKDLEEDPFRYGEKPKEEKPPSPIAKEKFAISKKITAGKRRSELIKNKGDKNFYEANVAIFNTTNSRNEVAYWGIEPGKLYGTNEVTKIIKLPGSLIAKGLTPKIIQQQADDSGKTIAEVLNDLGLLR